MCTFCGWYNCICKFNTQLQFVDNLLCTNRLSLNIGKINFMIISNGSSANHDEIKRIYENISIVKCSSLSAKVWSACEAGSL